MRATDGSGLRKRQRGFAAVPNSTAQDSTLSARARGVLLLVISLPEDWELRMEWLVDQFPEGRDAITTAVRELRRRGYYRVERRRRGNGTFTTGVSVSDVRVPEWAEQHAAACAGQNTDKPKWDVSLRVLDDGSVEDEPSREPRSAEPSAANGIPVSGEPVTGEPATGDPAVKTETHTQTDTTAEGVSHVSSDAAEQPPQDLPDGRHRTCPDHRLTPALGPCTPCGVYRRAHEAAQAQLATERAERDTEERRRNREASNLAAAERAACSLCDSDGFAAVLIAGDEKPASVKCLHDDDRNQRATEIRRQAKADLAARPRRAS